MASQGLTNLLLAIIAGVLLFGRESMLSALEGLLWIGLIIAVICVILFIASYLIRETLKAFNEAKSGFEAARVLFGSALLCIGALTLAYAGWLWFYGVPKPMDVAIESTIGRALLAVFMLVAAWAVLAGLRHAWKWAALHRSELPSLAVDYPRLFFRYYVAFLVSPVTFPIREWRIKSVAGASPKIRFVSAVWVSFVGFVFAMITALLTLAAVMAMLLGFGFIR